MYHLRASAPNSRMMSQGSTTFPLDLDIFCPFSSRMRPWQITFLKAMEPKSITPSWWRELNQPRVWSIPSAMKSAGKLSRNTSSCSKG